MQTYHLYSDGNYFPRAKKSGFGGYIESSTGEVLVEYTEQIKQPEYSYSFELLGIIRGLEIAKSNGIESIVSHCDDKNTTSKLKEIFEQKTYNINPSLKPELFDRIIELSKDFKKIKFEYIPRAQNKYADSLSRKYADMMEANFLNHYNKELDFAENKLSKETKTDKRIFFSHPSLVRTHYKINPYLVAPQRNKKVRRIAKDEIAANEYNYVFTEIFQKENWLHLHTTVYNKDASPVHTTKSAISPEELEQQSHVLPHYCSHLSKSLSEIKSFSKNLWIDTNYRSINNIFEQKEKINNELWDSFKTTFNDLNSFNRVFFHHTPFEPIYTPENKSNEIIKKKIDEEIETLDELIDKLEKGALAKDQNKCFGAIVRHQLKKYQSTLSRELNDLEKTQIIEDAKKDLTSRGFVFKK